MTYVRRPAHEVVALICEMIAGQGSHAFAKHHLKYNEFNRDKFGPKLDIRNPQDLIEHAFRILIDPATKIIHSRDVTIYAYHEETRTVALLNFGRDGGTIFRRFPGDINNGKAWYDMMLDFERDKFGQAQFKEKTGGLLEMLVKKPGLAQALDEKYTKLKKDRAAREQAPSPFRAKFGKASQKPAPASSRRFRPVHPPST